MTVENILQTLDIPYNHVILGEAELQNKPGNNDAAEIEKQLKLVGFEVIEGRANMIIENIRKLVREYIQSSDEKNQKLSSFITTHIPYEYSYLSDLFSSLEGTTIEQYFILQRIEKVKELIVYDHLTLTEIAYQTGFSSVHHLSAQFKKVTGLTPSFFKKIGAEKRKSIDKL